MARRLRESASNMCSCATPSDMDGVDAVILPGGESTTQWKFLVEEGLDKTLLAHAACGGAIFGTCAGTILLAREVRNPAQPSLGLADITVIRNGYGRQLASEVRREVTSISPAPIEMVFHSRSDHRTRGTGGRNSSRHRAPTRCSCAKAAS